MYSVYDCIVVGAGIEGSATAYQFAKRKYNTLLIEQFALPHSRGSSHGQSRIIRCASKQLYIAPMAEEALNMWHQLEVECSAQIFKKTGLLLIEPPPYDEYTEFFNAIQAVKRPHELYTGHKLNQTFSGAVRYGKDYKGMLEFEAGILKADTALICFQKQFVKFGGTLQDEEQVLCVIPGTTVTVQTTKGQYHTKRLVLAVGPWASQMLKPLGLDLPLQCLSINVCYWKEKTPGMYSSFPCFIDSTNKKYIAHIYGFPSAEYPGLMKVCYDGGTPIPGPDDRDSHGKQDDIKIIAQYIRDHLPGLEDKPSIHESCIYTNTPDRVPIIGTHPQYANVAFVCGMSGTGFKLAPVIGQLLYELVTGQEPSHDLLPFCYKRFSQQPLKKDIDAHTNGKTPPQQSKL